MRKSVLLPVMLTALLVLPMLFTGCKGGSDAEAVKEIVSAPAPAHTYAPLSSFKLATSDPDADGGQLLGVNLGNDTGMITVGFKAPFKLADTWQQGSIFVVDETTGIIYDNIPVMPIVGPLFGKPAEEGQPGYVMFYNYYAGVKAGALVTVIMGRFRREHVVVK
jgi:hypothetical protein